MIGRPNLCDSEFANKAYAGKAEDIRPCIGCGRCLNGIMFGKPISCTVNPSVETNAIEKATERKSAGYRRRSGRHGGSIRGKETRT